MKKYKVVQWATGGMGKNCLRAVIDHPAMELVGVYVYGADKARQGRGHHRATRTHRRPRDAQRRRDPRAGRGRRHPCRAARTALRLARCGHPAPAGCRQERHQHQRLQPAAALGRRASCSAGSGVQERRDVAARRGPQSGLCGRTARGRGDGCVHGSRSRRSHRERGLPAVRSPDYVFKILGFGTEPDGVNPNDPAWGPSSSLNGMYAEVLSTMAERLGMPLERVDTEHRVFPASTDLQIGAGVDSAGPRQPLQLALARNRQGLAASHHVHSLVHGDGAPRRSAPAAVAHPRAGAARRAHLARHGEAGRGHVTDVGRADCGGGHGHQCDSHRVCRPARHRDAATGHAVQFRFRAPGPLIAGRTLRRTPLSRDSRPCGNSRRRPCSAQP